MTSEQANTARALSLLQAAFEATGAAILAVDSQGAVSAHNQRFVDLFQVPEALMGPAGDNGPRVVHMAGQVRDPQWLKDYAAEIKKNPDTEYSGIVQFHDGRWIEGFSQPQRLNGDVVGRVWSFRDVTEHRKLQDQLRELSIRDPLTQLYNRRCAEEKLTLECQRAQRSKQPLSVALLDLDDFKSINDLHGHHVGDEVLCALADDLRKRLRATDLVCRWGGEEFLVILPDTDGDHAIEVVHELLRRVGRERRDLPSFTFSAGVAQYDGQSDWPALVKRADARMYDAKQTGRNRVV